MLGIDRRAGLEGAPPVRRVGTAAGSRFPLQPVGQKLRPLRSPWPAGVGVHGTPTEQYNEMGLDSLVISRQLAPAGPVRTRAGARSPPTWETRRAWTPDGALPCPDGAFGRIIPSHSPTALRGADCGHGTLADPTSPHPGLSAHDPPTATVALLQAAPLVHQGQPVDPLDLRAEREAVLSALRGSGMQVRAVCAAATTDTLRSAVSSEPGYFTCPPAGSAVHPAARAQPAAPT